MYLTQTAVCDVEGKAQSDPGSNLGPHTNWLHSLGQIIYHLSLSLVP